MGEKTSKHQYRKPDKSDSSKKAGQSVGIESAISSSGLEKPDGMAVPG